MFTGNFDWQGWIGAALILGLLTVLVGSFKRSAAMVDEDRTDLTGWNGAISGGMFALMLVTVAVWFQNLVLLAISGVSLYGDIGQPGVGFALAVRYLLPPLLSVIFYGVFFWLIVWERKRWVPKAASAMLWLAGPVVSIPTYVFFGMNPGIIEFGVPSALAALGTVYLLFSGRAAAVYNQD